jgi:hypothetical protein
LGHAKPPSLILLELLVSHTLSPLTNAEVKICLMCLFTVPCFVLFCEGLDKLRECVCVAVDCMCWVQYFRRSQISKVSCTPCGLEPRPVGRLICFLLSYFAVIPLCFSWSVPRLSFLVFFQYLGRQWTAEELAMGSELQGLGPGDVEAE